MSRNIPLFGENLGQMRSQIRHHFFQQSVYPERSRGTKFHDREKHTQLFPLSQEKELRFPQSPNQQSFENKTGIGNGHSEHDVIPLGVQFVDVLDDFTTTRAGGTRTSRLTLACKRKQSKSVVSIMRFFRQSDEESSLLSTFNLKHRCTSENLNSTIKKRLTLHRQSDVLHVLVRVLHARVQIVGDRNLKESISFLDTHSLHGEISVSLLQKKIPLST